MHTVGKIIIGFILIIIGLGLFVNSISPIISWIGDFWLENFIIVLSGVIPIFLILVGLFVVWLEIDELKAEQELKEEPKKKKK